MRHLLLAGFIVALMGAGCADTIQPVVSNTPTSSVSAPTPSSTIVTSPVTSTAPIPKPSLAPTPAPAPTPTPKPVVKPAPKPVVPKTVTVEMLDNSFSPQVVAIHEGDTVVWINKGANGHTSTGANGALLWDSGNILPGATYRHTFLGEGKYDYRCAIHGMMTGTVNVGKVIPAT